MIDYSTIKQSTLDAIHRWVDHGIPGGGFVTAVLENDLHDAVARADEDNLAALHSIVAYVYNEIPANAWGSKGKCADWYKRHREQREAESGSH